VCNPRHAYIFKVLDPDMAYLQHLVSEAAHPCVLLEQHELRLFDPRVRGLAQVEPLDF
jgi:hypothetical protein